METELVISSSGSCAKALTAAGLASGGKRDAKHGAPCLAQDQPEETMDHFFPAIAVNPSTASATDVTAPPPLRAPLPEPALTHTRPSYSYVSGCIPSMAEISKTLHAALPWPKERDIIYRASSRHSAMPNGSKLTMPYTWLDFNGPTSSASSPAPASLDSQPVLIARHIPSIVTFLQDLHPNIHHELAGLNEPARIMAERFAELAIGLVISQDRMLASIEGLECVVLESVYHGNCDSLRLSWIACRRAMLLVQLLGLHTPATPQQYRVLDHATQCDPQYMWFRIVHYMCLLLGLPQGSTDVNMASEAIIATDTAMGGLERVQCVIASHILQRNESDPTSVDFSVTQSLDKDLQRAAQTLPSKWWLDLENPKTNQVAYNCRIVDYLAVMAAVTLLLAHLDSYCHPSQVDIMTHLYLGDWAMIDRQSADLLRRLLAIEAEAADGYHVPAHNVVVQQVAHNAPLVNKVEEDTSKMHIPYLGLIEVALNMQSQAPIQQSAASLNTSYASASSSQRGLDGPGTTIDTQNSYERESLVLATPYDSAGIVIPAGIISQQPSLATGIASVHDDAGNPKFSEDSFFDSPLSGLTGNDEWSLEGIDINYFEGLVAGSMTCVNGNSESNNGYQGFKTYRTCRQRFPYITLIQLMGATNWENIRKDPKHMRLKS
ncbi:hypothetical protein yc1106_07700 [Curvularia clavata]|uniref:Transcription factor domain-containing protein n=1 Tax=Curvularia clavata TaxID=95742 RepID=A0A9Q8ZC35_CURCL|nr:hypothetical protein yc1106_07700 [Curvularia clavata]